MAKNRGRTANHARGMKSKTAEDAQALFGEIVDFQPEEPKAERKRLFFTQRVFWMFLGQVLSGNISCHATVQRALAWLCWDENKTASPNTAAYCKARQRLKIEWLEEVQVEAAEKLEKAVGEEDRWFGRPVKVVDGSGLSMPDTEENQKRFPQSKRQKKGCGFPTMRIVAFFSLSTGALLRLAHGTLKTSERALFHQLWKWLEPGDVVLADRGFTSFADFFLLQEKGVESVMRNHQRRTKNVRFVKRLGRRDKLVAWKRTGNCPNWIEKEAWRSMPREILVRQIDLRIDLPGFRTEKVLIVTTVLDAKTYRAEEFIDLYRQRWFVEIFLRDIKISLGMDVLKCKTPEMVLKELQMYMIAYNLIRSAMYRSAVEHEVDVLRISFKRTADTLREWLPVLRAVRDDIERMNDLTLKLIHYISLAQAPNRPNRCEPRALKRRKKNYQLLNKPRGSFKEIQHRNKYRAGLS